MARKFLGAFEVGGVEGKKPSEMTDEELDAWADALAEAVAPIILERLAEEEEETT